MTAVRVYVQTGERFDREDNGPFTIGVASTTGESSNKIYQFAVSPNSIPDFAARKPLDAGSMKILSNNISHLLYQKCRTIAAVNGPGNFGLLKYPGLPIDSFQADSGATGPEQFREITWNRTNSIRLGPFSAMIDRKTQDQPSLQSTLPANAECLRKMVLVINGYKREESVLRFHVCGSTNAAAIPVNSRSSLLRVDASQLAWIEFVNGASAGLATTIPAAPYSAAQAYERQSWTAYTAELISPYEGDYKLFIPLDFLIAPEQNNWSPTENSSVLKLFVWLGWSSISDSNGIRSITLLESRDVGTAEVS